MKLFLLCAAGVLATVSMAGDDSAVSNRWYEVITYEKPDKTPVVCSGWSKANGVDVDEYCIYLDVTYDNKELIYGPRAVWRQGTHGWEETRALFIPQRPVKKIEMHAFARKGEGRGKALFRDVKLERREPRPGERFYVARQSERPFADEIETVWDTYENGQLVHHREAAHDPSPRQSPIPSGKAVVWTADAMRLVTALTFPTADDLGSRSIALELAGRERESAQILVSTAADVEWRAGSLEMPTLVDAKGNPLKGEVTWQRVGYIGREPGYYHTSYPGEAPFEEKWIPDPLFPAAPFRVRRAATQALWLTVRADADAAAGTYRGVVRVTEGGVLRAKVPLAVTVRPFALPKTFGLKTAFSLMDGFTRAQYGEAREREMKTQAIDVLLDHRLNPDDISRTTPPELEDLLHARERGMNAFNILNVARRPKSKRTKWVIFSEPGEAESEEFYRDFKARLEPAVKAYREHGLLDMAYVYGFDERGRDYYKGVDTIWNNLRRDFPGVPLMTTAKMYADLAANKTNSPYLLSSDWYCPTTDKYKPELSDDLRAKGKQVWWYTCCTPRSPYANMASFEWPAVDGRILLGWMTPLYRADGFLFWHVNHWKDDPCIDESDVFVRPWRTRNMTIRGPITGCASDGVFLYPGKDHILPSIHLALVRDGVEDCEWYQLAAAKAGAEKVDALARELVASMKEFSRDPAKIRDVRRRVGDLIGMK